MEIQSQSITTAASTVTTGSSSTSVKTGAGVAASASSQASSPAVSTPATPSASQSKLEDAVKSIDQFINVKQPPELSFSIDQATDQTVVRITDSSTGKLIRQIPSEEAIQIAQSLDKAKGLLLKQEA